MYEQPYDRQAHNRTGQATPGYDVRPGTVAISCEESRDWPEKAGIASQAERLILELEKKRALPGAGQPTE